MCSFYKGDYIFTWRIVDRPAAFGHFHLEDCQVLDLDLVLLAQVSGQVGGRGFHPGLAERTDVEGLVSCRVLDELGQFEAGIGVLVLVSQALFLCALFLTDKENIHLFSSSLPCFDKCHETSPINRRTEQTFGSARSFGVIS